MKLIFLMLDTIKLTQNFIVKFTAATGIKVNLINGKAGALEKRMIEEGADSAADLYITADAGRCGAFKAKGMTQAGLVSCQLSNLQFQKTLEQLTGLE